MSTARLIRLRVSNFRSLAKDVEIRFGPLTALVGPNGSGKSNVVDALRFLSDAMRIGLSGAVTQRHGIRAVRRWSASAPYDVRFRVELGLGQGGQATYGFVLKGDRFDEYRVASEQAEVVIDGERHAFSIVDGQWQERASGLEPAVQRDSLALPLVGGDTRFEPLVEALKRIAVYSIFPDTLREPQKYDPRKPMDRHGANWASLLRDQDESTWKADLVQALSRLTGGDIEDVRIRPAAGLLVVELGHRSRSKKNKKWLGTAQQSDGTLRVAGILTALLQKPSVPVLCIEEPELTVHPGVIELLFDYLREASSRSQVILTTHSPELLDLLDVEQVQVVYRNGVGATQLGPMREGQKAAVREGLLSLGEVHRMEGLQAELPLAEEPAP